MGIMNVDKRVSQLREYYESVTRDVSEAPIVED